VGFLGLGLGSLGGGTGGTTSKISTTWLKDGAPSVALRFTGWVCSGQLLMCAVDLDMHTASVAMGGPFRSQKTKRRSVCVSELSKQQLPVLKFQTKNL